MKNGFMRIAACTPAVKVADVAFNTESIIKALDEASSAGADIALLPELCVTAYTCGDLFHNSTLLDAADRALGEIASHTGANGPALAVVGAPMVASGVLYNCAVALAGGRPVAVVPKTYLPSYNEFYEKRWFATPSAAMPATVTVGGHTVPFGTDILINVGGVGVGIELCEDLWAPLPPGTRLAMAGAEVILNLSASDDVVGKYGYLKSLCAQQSARCLCAYAYASAGYGESTTDLVFDGKDFIYENGRLLASTNRYDSRPKAAVADVDIEALRRDRLHLTTWAGCCAENAMSVRHVEAGIRGDRPTDSADLLRHVDPHPFVPADDSLLAERCHEIIHIQSTGLRRRLDATGCKAAVIGISGGLDSTLALLVAVKAFDDLGLDRRGITGVTMPGFGTTGRTHSNALELMRLLGVTSREIAIGDAVRQHFADIGHNPEVRDVTYENSQARERTQILMDVANQAGGMVVGTGDLSELALGWATYNGDHMSMYGVNAGVPKTLVRHLVSYFARTAPDAATARVLDDIVATPISPELIPADAADNITQVTEDIVGPYELHDFYLYQMLRHGFGPRRIMLLACKAFAGVYDEATIRKWLKTFVRRFFAQQFKRSCLPDGPKVGSVTLSPRGDWRMPSDASASLWLAECDEWD